MLDYRLAGHVTRLPQHEELKFRVEHGARKARDGQLELPSSFSTIFHCRIWIQAEVLRIKVVSKNWGSVNRCSSICGDEAIQVHIWEFLKCF